MEICDWPQKHIQSIAHFYFNLELDPMHACPNGERVLIIYQAKVRRQWHNDLAHGQGFNITQINQKLLSVVAEEVWDTVRTEAIRTVSISQNFPLRCVLKNFSSLPISPIDTIPETNDHYPTIPCTLPHIYAKKTLTMMQLDAMPCQSIHQLPCHATHTANHAMPTCQPANQTAKTCHPHPIHHVMPLAMPIMPCQPANQTAKTPHPHTICHAMPLTLHPSQPCLPYKSFATSCLQ